VAFLCLIVVGLTGQRNWETSLKIGRWELEDAEDDMHSLYMDLLTV